MFLSDYCLILGLSWPLELRVLLEVSQPLAVAAVEVIVTIIILFSSPQPLSWEERRSQGLLSSCLCLEMTYPGLSLLSALSLE